MARGKLGVGDGRTVLGEKLRKRHQRFANVYAKMMLSGNGIDYHKLGLVFNPSEKIPEAKAKILVKKKVIQDMIDDELDKILVSQGIDKSKAVTVKMQILDDCKDDNGKFVDRQVAYKISQDLEKWTGIDNKKQITTTEQVDFIQMAKEGDSKETKKVTAKREIKGLPDGEEK